MPWRNIKWRQEDIGFLELIGAVLSKVVRESLTEQVTFGQISEEGENGSHVATWEKVYRQRGCVRPALCA